MKWWKQLYMQVLIMCVHTHIRNLILVRHLITIMQPEL